MSIQDDFKSKIKKIRADLGLTQKALADLLGVSYVTVNRWENDQSRPRQLAWEKIERLARYGPEGIRGPAPEPGEPDRAPERPVHEIDFGADPEVVRLVAEAERLSHGHLFNPSFATEISSIDPLPHQRLAVYERMLLQPRLRFLLADDAGAGKTIMTGLYVREMLARRLIRRVLVVPPAGLVGNWEREMRVLFRLPFRIVSGAEARTGNPFIGSESDLAIVSVDTLAGEPTFRRLQELGEEAGCEPYDLVVFDEAHKLSADRDARTAALRRTDRYRLAEALAGVRGREPRWRLDWHPRHLLLLTATPHMGKDFPYYCLWRLLEPDGLPTIEAFEALSREQRIRHFIRRTKEEMVSFDGSRLYPMRVSDTLTFDLTQGPDSEQELYDDTTAYLRSYYNRARILNRSAARLAMGVFQRRLASSTYALLRSLERRAERIDAMIRDLEAGRIGLETFLARQREMDRTLEDPLEESAADDEPEADGEEAHERAEDELLAAVVAESIADLQAEGDKLEELIALARRVDESGQESKFQRLAEVIEDPAGRGEKLLIFTEHRDTLDYLARRLGGLGFTGQIAQIHGGMHFRDRERQVEFFRKPGSEGGADILIATDAAGEGINLQFCWRMVNYDVPWNPARLEQRMGRIHRYGQEHDPVVILNLVAAKTREGRVLHTLLDKLERIRQELQSDKVFDVIGRIFEGVSIKQYMEQATTDEGASRATEELAGRLTKEQVEALRARERALYGSGGEVAEALPRLRDAMDRDGLRRLIPGYVRRFVETAAPRLGLFIEGSLDSEFQLRALQERALDMLLKDVNLPADQDLRLSVTRPARDSRAVFFHPGEPLFERFRVWVADQFSTEGLRGAVFIDPGAEAPYLFHLLRVELVRRVEAQDALPQEQLVEARLVGIRESQDGALEECPVEHLLLLRRGQIRPALVRPFVATARSRAQRVRAYAHEHVAEARCEKIRAEIRAELPEREAFLRRGFDHEMARLAARRIELAQRARDGDAQAKAELERVRERQKAASSERDRSLAGLHREPELIVPGTVETLVRALVLPTTSPEDREAHDAAVERVAMDLAAEYERARGAQVRDVSTPDLARRAGLSDWPGFDLISARPDGSRRCIEVKGRARTGGVEVKENEWAAACNLRRDYWMYVVFGCATPTPDLIRVSDPFGKLLAKQKGGVLVDASQIREHAEPEL